MQNLTVLKHRVGPVRGRHPWIFSGALKAIPEGLKGGQEVRLVDEQANFLAYGYFNSYSQIAVRLWSWDEKEKIDDSFFEKRIQTAYNIRQNYVASKETDSYRLVYGENDLLPGLVVDKYADYLCVQFHNPGIRALKDSFWFHNVN
jgi:23S rRNA (cytosine1962-C5)-methyltransferase